MGRKHTHKHSVEHAKIPVLSAESIVYNLLLSYDFFMLICKYVLFQRSPLNARPVLQYFAKMGQIDYSEKYVDGRFDLGEVLVACLSTAPHRSRRPTARTTSTVRSSRQAGHENLTYIRISHPNTCPNTPCGSFWQSTAERGVHSTDCVEPRHIYKSA